MNSTPVLLLLLSNVVLVLSYGKVLKDLEEECSALDPCVTEDPDVTELTYLRCVVKNKQVIIPPEFNLNFIPPNRKLHDRILLGFRGHREVQVDCVPLGSKLLRRQEFAANVQEYVPR